MAGGVPHAALYPNCEAEWFGDVANPIEQDIDADFGPDGIGFVVRDPDGNIIDSVSIPQGEDMFSWFRKKRPAGRDLVWLSEEARRDQLRRIAVEASEAVLLLAFFAESEAALGAALEGEGVAFTRLGDRPLRWPADARLLLGRVDRLRLLSDPPADLRVEVAERHPLPPENERLAEVLGGLSAAIPTFHGALDEPLMQRFGGEQVVSLAHSLGVSPDAPIEHALVGRALQNARNKVGAKVKNPRNAPSMAAWLALNLDGG